MTGPFNCFNNNNNRGIIQRATEDIFDYIDKHSENNKFVIKASYLQIYNENINDLLVNKKTNNVNNINLNKSLNIREDKNKGIFVENLSEWNVNNVNDVGNLLKLGMMYRNTSPNYMNEYSSRSHAVFSLIIEQMNFNNVNENDNNNNNEDNKGKGELNQDKEINALKQKISEQNNISEELRKIVDNKEKKNDQYKKNLSEMQEQLDTYKNAVGLLTEEKGEHINEIQKLKEMNKKLEQELSYNGNNNIIDKKDEIKSINQNSEKDEKRIKELEEKSIERDGLIETLQGIISGDKNINELKNDKEEWKIKYNKLKEEKEEIEKKIKLNDENNKKLEEKIKYLNTNNEALYKELNEYKNKNIIASNDNNNNDNKIIKKKLEELIAENENIKNKTILEHQLISSSMFEMAIQFFKLKKDFNEIQNQENNSQSTLSWIEIERRKNFPCEYYN